MFFSFGQTIILATGGSECQSSGIVTQPTATTPINQSSVFRENWGRGMVIVSVSASVLSPGGSA